MRNVYYVCDAYITYIYIFVCVCAPEPENKPVDHLSAMRGASAVKYILLV